MGDQQWGDVSCDRAKSAAVSDKSPLIRFSPAITQALSGLASPFSTTSIYRMSHFHSKAFVILLRQQAALSGNAEMETH